MADNIFTKIQNSSESEIRDFINTQFGGQVNYTKDDDGSSVLHFAAFYAGNAEVVKVFVSMGAVVNAQAFNGATPLHVAGDAQIAKTLVSLGANLNTKTKDGRTPLHFAVSNDVPEVVNALVELGADTNIKEKNGFTPFDMAVGTGKIKSVEILLSKGANVNANDHEGLMTPLHMAAISITMKSGYSVPIAKLLIANGADSNAKTQAGDTPLDLAKKAGDAAMVQYLSSIISSQDKAEIDRISAMYANSLRENPNDAKVYEERGTTFMAHALANGGLKAFVDLAMADFSKAIKLDPKAAGAYVSRAGLYSQINDLDHAIADYDSAIRIEPNNAEYYTFRGGFYAQKGNYDQALADFNNAIRLNPQYSNAYGFRGGMYFQKSVQNKENEDFDKAVEDIDQAIKDIEESQRLDPKNEATAFIINDIRNEKEVVYRLRREEEENKRREAEEQERYLKETARKAMFKKIALAACAAVVVIIIGLILYNSQKNILVIPAGVTSIGDREYSRKQLVNLEIPDGVTVIGKEAFKKNKLSGVEIPASVTYIGDNAFAGNKLTSIKIGANVTMGSSVFDSSFDSFYSQNGSSAGTYIRPDIKSFRWVTWYNNFEYQYKDGNISIISYNGIGGDLEIPGDISGYPVTVIGKKAFFEKNITSVIIPNSVITIDEMAFFGRYDSAKKAPLGTISSVSIGENVTTIGDRVFENNLLSTITIPNKLTSIGYSAFADNPVTSVRLGANVKLGDKGNNGILGEGTGFNGAYANNGRRAGTYTRPNAKSTTWTRR